MLYTSIIVVRVSVVANNRTCIELANDEHNDILIILYTRYIVHSIYIINKYVIEQQEQQQQQYQGSAYNTYWQLTFVIHVSRARYTAKKAATHSR